MKRILFLITLTLSPIVVFGATNGFQGLLLSASGIISKLIILVMSLALLAFFWGLARTIFDAGNAEKREEGRNIMKYGILALFIVVSIWGIIGFLQQGFGLK